MNKYDWRYLLRQLSRVLTGWSRWDSTVYRGERHHRRHGPCLNRSRAPASSAPRGGRFFAAPCKTCPCKSPGHTL